MAAKKARRARSSQDFPFPSSSANITVGEYRSRNTNASRDQEKALRGLYSATRGAGATRIGQPSSTFSQQRGMGNRKTGTSVSVSQPVLIPVKGKKNTVTYGKATSKVSNKKGALDTKKTSVKAAKGKGFSGRTK